MWDYGQYNLIVKQVEGCSDILRSALGNVKTITLHSAVSLKLQKHLEAAAKDLDKRALRMLALYDGAAQEMLRNGVTYDPRRDLFRKGPDSPSANAPKPKLIAAPKRAPKNKRTL
jgi:hypothetical protein